MPGASPQAGSEPPGSLSGKGSRRGTNRRGENRQREILEAVSDDLAKRGLVGFSLRRAALAAGATHKVLLYHFGSAEELLRQCLHELRARRIDAAGEAAWQHGSTLAQRVQFVWRELAAEAEEPRVLDQATGLALYDPVRYRELGRDATEQYLPDVASLCPPDWPEERRLEVATLVLAALRGLLLDWLTGQAPERVEAGLAALSRALEAEEARPGS
jgi:AcrR family transcriptional regulator